MKLAALFCDHMIFQRNQVVSVWGWDTPGTEVTVSVAGGRGTARAGADGKWLAKLPSMPAGGPHEMTVAGTQTLVVRDVMVGEVWIASGQSNMEFPLSQSNSADKAKDAIYASIRLFTVPRSAEVEVQTDVNSRWVVCSPETASPFSGVAYLFGLELHRKLGVPVGLISTSWGGTMAEAWTTRSALKSQPTLSSMVDDYERFLADNPGASEEYEAKLKAWRQEAIKSDPGNAGHAKGWAAEEVADDGWGQMELPRFWQSAGHNYSGVFWFRREVDVPAAWAGRDLVLSLGAVDKADTTYFNNVQVGSLTMEQDPNAWCTPRVYTVPGKLVKAGRNVVAVRVFSNMNAGGFGGKAQEMALSPAAQKPLSLAGDWQFKVEANFGLLQPLGLPMPLGKGNANSPTILYNSMIAPLIPFGIAGAIWYQGESNVGRAQQYRTLFPTMIRSWRQDWGLGDFPFLFVQIANYFPVKEQPVRSEWAELREAQTMTLSLPNTAQAVAIDIGEALDIHPKNKQDVASRLALAALAKVYGFEGLVYSGPMYESCRVEGSAVRVKFAHTAGGLMAKGGTLKGFAIAGEDRQFVWADACIEGQTVVISSPAVPAPAAVRYAWAENPVCNLYNTSDLPACPFRTDDWDGA